jgi:RNA polymerase sigma-70 factor (ECF subfamily)
MNIAVHSDLERLIDRARAGDASVLGKLLEGYRNYLTLLARLTLGRRLQGKLDDSDLVQEAFLEAHRDFGQFRGTTEKELTSWLRRILAHNLANVVRHYCGTQGRDVRLERELEVELERSSQIADPGLVAAPSSPSREAAHREQMVLVANALSQLPKDYREVLILRHLEGLSFPEVAKRMDRTLSSVDKLWVRALARLRRVLGVVS